MADLIEETYNWHKLTNKLPVKGKEMVFDLPPRNGQDMKMVVLFDKKDSPIAAHVMYRMSDAAGDFWASYTSLE